MKTFTVIQAGNVFELEAETFEYYPERAYLIRNGAAVFAGPAAFTTIIDNGAIKSRPSQLYDGTMEKPDES